MKNYIVSYYVKKNNQEFAHAIAVSAESARAARAKFDAAYKAAETGCHAFRIKVRLDREVSA